MKQTLKITLKNEQEYKEYAKMLEERGYIQIGTRLFEGDGTYIRFKIEN